MITLRLTTAAHQISSMLYILLNVLIFRNYSHLLRSFQIHLILLTISIFTPNSLSFSGVIVISSLCLIFLILELPLLDSQADTKQNKNTVIHGCTFQSFSCLKSMIKYYIIPLYTAWDVNYHFVLYICDVYATCFLVTQQLSR